MPNSHSHLHSVSTSFSRAHFPTFSLWLCVDIAPSNVNIHACIQKKTITTMMCHQHRLCARDFSLQFIQHTTLYTKHHRCGDTARARNILILLKNNALQAKGYNRFKHMLLLLLLLLLSHYSTSMMMTTRTTSKSTATTTTTNDSGK